MAGYTHPEMLVETAWVEEHEHDPGIRIAEVDVDTTPTRRATSRARSLELDDELCDTVRRDVIPKDQFEQLMAKSGIGNDTR